MAGPNVPGTHVQFRSEVAPLFSVRELLGQLPTGKRLQDAQLHWLQVWAVADARRSRNHMHGGSDMFI